MAAPCTATINSLGDDVLGVIFLFLPALDRAGPVPRVCRRWHRITAHASMWPVLCVATQDSSVVAWLRQRSSGLRHLFLQEPGDPRSITRALAAVAPSASQLQQLQLLTGYTDDTDDEDADSCDTFDIAQLACISHLRSLTGLTIRGIGTPCEPASLNNTLTCLPALKVVSLEFHEANSLAALTGLQAPILPLAFPSGLLRCTKLTSMEIGAALESPHACTIPAGITALQHLQHLGLQHCVHAPLPRSLSQMTRLTSLKVAQYTSEVQELLFRDPDGPMPMPISLHVLNVPMAPVESLRPLSALQRLRLTAPKSQPSDPSGFSMLKRLTSLRLESCSSACWMKFEGCTRLRALHLHVWDTEEPQPLPFQRLTRLQLQGGRVNVRKILIMALNLPRLEVLEVPGFTCQAVELRRFDAAALSRLPKLRLVDLSGSLLWDDLSDDDTSGHQPVQGDDMVDYLPVRVVQQLLHLQRAFPNITWVVD